MKREEVSVAESVKPGTHSCVVNPGLKDAQPSLGGRYSRMFPALPACEVDEEAVVGLGRSASRMDAMLPVVDAALDNPRIPAGFTVFGQFVAHDITYDQSELAHRVAASELRNFRAPRLDLESLYGAGPIGAPFLYDVEDPDKLLLGASSEGEAHDLPRNFQGRALIGDPRNDVHLIISQMHLAFLMFHNRVVDWLRERGTTDVFEEARRLVSWHYEWIVAREFLPLSVGEEMASNVEKAGRKVYDPGDEPSIPAEFSDAAYRFGHSQITPTYTLNDSSGEVALFPDCLGSRPVPPERVIDWTWFFEIPGAHPPQPSRRLVASLTHTLMDLPDQIVGHTEIPEHHSLAARDLQRGSALGLPSGEAVARAIGAEPLTAEEFGLGDGWSGETPFWYYVLKEAEVRAGGEHLGSVGGRIVAEVLLGLLDADPGSYRNVEPDWRPVLPSTEPGRFTMADLLVFAGVPMGAA
jgi:hypothetical protein